MRYLEPKVEQALLDMNFIGKYESEREKKMKISHVRGKNISNMGYSCRFNFGKFLLV